MAAPDFYDLRFEWPHQGPNNVFVTGTFDKWTRSIKLTKSETGFIAVVKVPWAQKILYKFVVDGEWICQPGQPTERDPAGFINNVYFSPPKPIAVAVPEPVKVPFRLPPAPPKPATPEPVVAEENVPPVVRRKSIIILPLNSTEHNTIGTAPAAPPVPEFVLPPPPRARSASRPPTRESESARPLEMAPEQLNEVEGVPELPVLTSPEVSAEEQKQETEAHIPLDSNTTPEPEIKKEITAFPEPEPSPVVVENKPSPASLPTPPETPRAAKGLSPEASPSSSRFGTASSRKKRRSFIDKLKGIFSDKDKDKVKK